MLENDIYQINWIHNVDYYVWLLLCQYGTNSFLINAAGPKKFPEHHLKPRIGARICSNYSTAECTNVNGYQQIMTIALMMMRAKRQKKKIICRYRNKPVVIWFVSWLMLKFNVFDKTRPLCVRYCEYSAIFRFKISVQGPNKRLNEVRSIYLIQI